MTGPLLTSCRSVLQACRNQRMCLRLLQNYARSADPKLGTRGAHKQPLASRFCNSFPTENALILFWLDAHYSGAGTARGFDETPILEEMQVIRKRHQPDVILIDDARLFGLYDWPSLEDLQLLCQLDRRIMTIEDDIIRLEPKSL